ncbi:MAG: 50S ribosomal protein L22 [Candidatus Dormibacteria bacterium]
MEVVAAAKSVRVTARKARIITDAVVGLPVAEALTILQFTPRHAAREVAKVIRSAAANAEHNYNLEQSALRVARIDVEGAGMLKRYIPKPRGQAGSIFKRMSHLRAFVTDDELAPHTKRRSAVSLPRQIAPAPVSRTTGTAKRRRVREAPAEAVAETPETGAANEDVVESTPKKRARRSTATAGAETENTIEPAAESGAETKTTGNAAGADGTPDGDKE